MKPTMQALTLPPGSNRLAVVSVPRPEPGPGQILVQVLASAVNEMDVEVRAGGWRREVRRFRRAGPVVTGFEFAGVACSSGPRIRAGERVIGYTHLLHGARVHAEMACVNEADLVALPPGLPAPDAAALVVMGLTAIDILERVAPVRPGQQVLVIGAAGGVGVYTVQLARALGARVTAVGGRANADWLRVQGADTVRCTEDGPPFRPGDRFDLVVDVPCVASFAGSLPFLAERGAYVNTNPLRDLGGFVRAALSRRRAGWLMMLATTPPKLQALLDRVARGALRPVIDSQFPLARADAAFDRYATRGKRGRVLLTMGEPGP